MMMNKPANWDSVEAITGEYKKLPAGGYVCSIVRAECTKSKNGKEMLKLAIDIAEGEYKDFYLNQYLQEQERNKEQAKWRGSYYQLTEGDSMGRFKGMLLNIEKSNSGYKWNWNEKSLEGKLFGGVFREEEYINRNGGLSTTVKLISIRPVEGITDIEPPAKKVLENNNNLAENFGEEIPF